MRWAVLALVALVGGCGEDLPPCLKTERRTIYHPPWLQLMPVGTVLVPIQWPGHIQEVDVCVERVKK